MICVRWRATAAQEQLVLEATAIDDAEQMMLSLVL